MCRVLAYLGEPVSLELVLFETDSSLVRQSYSPRMMETFLNLGGMGRPLRPIRRSFSVSRHHTAGL
jgi:hypothetical protein